jgi:hypothetical protein
VALVKPGRGPWAYQEKNSSRAMLYPFAGTPRRQLRSPETGPAGFAATAASAVFW